MKISLRPMVMAATVVVLASCGMESLYNPDAAVERKEAQYEKGFVQKFGEIAPNQDWGFGTATTATRSLNMNGNEYKNTYILPDPITPDEIKTVVAYFKAHTNETGISLGSGTYFVQEVYQTDATFIAADSVNTYTVANMNNFRFTKDGNAFANQGKIQQANLTNDRQEGIVLAENEDPHEIVFHTVSNYFCDKTHNVIFQINGSYYIGFDFEAQGQNPNEKVSRDYDYSDVIFKITPAEKIDGTTNPDPQPSKTITYEKRIICEDLGGMGDFDFNDVVFDAYIDYTNNKTYIKLLAAGGTLHLTVAGMEVHEAFGVGQSVMVNTGGTSKEPVTLEVSRTYDSYNDIPIVVSSSTDEAGYFTSYTLKAKIGEAPQKIAVGTDYVWCDEEESIETRYPKFKDFVSDPSLDHSWYSAAGTTGGTTGGKVIWTGSWTCDWTGNLDLAWGGYDWSTFKAGQKLVFTLGFTASSGSWACIYLKTGNWTGLSCGQINLTASAEDQNVEFEPTANDINLLKNDGGLRINGQGSILKKVSIQ